MIPIDVFYCANVGSFLQGGFMLRVAHLFSGAGGDILAGLILGHEPVLAVEYSKFCCDVLRERKEDGWLPSTLEIIVEPPPLVP
jgi:hypothetical protein